MIKYGASFNHEAKGNLNALIIAFKGVHINSIKYVLSYIKKYEHEKKIEEYINSNNILLNLIIPRNSNEISTVDIHKIQLECLKYIFTDFENDFCSIIKLKNNEHFLAELIDHCFYNLNKLYSIRFLIEEQYRLMILKLKICIDVNNICLETKIINLDTFDFYKNDYDYYDFIKIDLKGIFEFSENKRHQHEQQSSSIDNIFLSSKYNIPDDVTYEIIDVLEDLEDKFNIPNNIEHKEIIEDSYPEQNGGGNNLINMINKKRKLERKSKRKSKRKSNFKRIAKKLKTKKTKNKKN